MSGSIPLLLPMCPYGMDRDNFSVYIYLEESQQLICWWHTDTSSASVGSCYMSTWYRPVYQCSVQDTVHSAPGSSVYWRAEAHFIFCKGRISCRTFPCAGRQPASPSLPPTCSYETTFEGSIEQDGSICNAVWRSPFKMLTATPMILRVFVVLLSPYLELKISPGRLLYPHHSALYLVNLCQRR